MPDPRPNFLLIMTDQQRGDCLSIEGHPVLMTPNMDAIAGAGVRFARAYSTCPSCIAARRSLMTGQHPATHGMVGYRDNLEWDAPPTLPGTLKAAGYQTALIGRSMHLHPRRKRYGFDQMVIHDHTDASDYGEWLARNSPDTAGGYYGGGVMHNDWTARPWHLDESLHMTHWTVSRAMDYLRKRDPACPFFLVVSFLAPHPPLNPPAFYLDRYLRQELPDPIIGDWATPPEHDGLGDDVSAAQVHLKGEALRSARAAYYGHINHIDDQIRRLLNPIDGIDRMTGGNTVVLFTSDHGEMLGDHYLWRKSVPYEPSARIPLLLRAPKQFNIAPRQALDQPVCLEDIMPTVLEMAGVDVPKTVEGRSLLPLMTGQSTRPSDWRDHLHIEHAPIHQTLTDGKEKYIWFVADGREQFFDLTTDPHEQHDLSRDPSAADRLACWRSRLIEQLQNRPEGFTDAHRLIPGRPYRALLPHGGSPEVARASRP